jgi:hypothetical protein
MVEDLKIKLIFLAILVLIMAKSFDTFNIVFIPLYFIICLYILLPNQKN